MTTRSLCVAKIGTSSDSSLGTADLALLYYENTTGKVPALWQESYDLLNYSQEWIDITSQESRSLLDEFHNAPGSVAEDNSEALTELLAPNVSTLSAPFACRVANYTQNLGIEAVFYSPNASGSELFQSNFYWTNSSGAGIFSSRMHFVFSYAFMMFIS